VPDELEFAPELDEGPIALDEFPEEEFEPLLDGAGPDSFSGLLTEHPTTNPETTKARAETQRDLITANS
jgi:hypothetical protein